MTEQLTSLVPCGNVLTCCRSLRCHFLRTFGRFKGDFHTISSVLLSYARLRLYDSPSIIGIGLYHCWHGEWCEAQNTPSTGICHIDIARSVQINAADAVQLSGIQARCLLTLFTK